MENFRGRPPGFRNPRRNDDGNWRNPSSGTGENVSREGRFFTDKRQNSRGFPRSQQNRREINEDNRTRYQGRPRLAFNNASSRSRLGFLEDLLKKEPEEIILELLKEQKGFVQLLETVKTPDTIVLIVKTLKKICSSSFNDSKYKILQASLGEKFINNLKTFIACLPDQDEDERKNSSFFFNEPNEFWSNLIEICEDILQATPIFACKCLPKILNSLKLYIPLIEQVHNITVNDELKRKIEKLSGILDILIKENEEKLKPKKEKVVDVEEPPDDFRQISVYPSAEEIVGGRGFLRENVVKGPYQNVDHYLDVQFRLLREDFVGPLRDGIANYRSPATSTSKMDNVKVHKGVRFLKSETINEYYCLRVQFGSKKKKKHNYENSRRFMFGCLLCFTKDNFKSLIFGKVAQRNVEELEKGELVVAFDEKINVEFNADYLMVECNVYFEPYFHVLTVLKKMTEENFPMERYIIQVNPTVQPPEYLVGSECMYKIEECTFNPLSDWPNENFYHLNESQLTAFKAAITEEISVIQGPPGTGKTYLGLKVAQTLLENIDSWYERTPILIICYTNHALDQFLEGLIPHTKRIVRVGGQSKNTNLDPFNLRNKVERDDELIYKRREVQYCLNDIKATTEILQELEFYNSILSFSLFEKVVPNFYFSWFYRANKNNIIEWLLEGGYYQNLNDNYMQDYLKVQQEFANIDISDDINNDGNSLDENEQFSPQFDNIFDILKTKTNFNQFLITLKTMRDNLKELEDALVKLRNEPSPSLQQLIQEENLNCQVYEFRQKYEYLKKKLSEGRGRRNLVREPVDIDLQNPHNMEFEDRWNLYFYWLNLYKDYKMEQLKEETEKFPEIYKVYEEMRQITDVKTMRDALVVGMTTTSAARLQSSLQTLKNPIVIVEEAAEVVEAHIVTSITKHCKHLILIGDHKQLKPNTANLTIERKYRLGISLFERMIINNIHCYTLNVQHRMRPEISCLIRPTIYSFLEDHPSVQRRPSITGINSNIFFIDHKNPEESYEDSSKINYHEVNFLIYLARHLVLNGHDPKSITILAAYLGQFFAFKKERKYHMDVLEDIRIAVLDNYQGEESDIILLSLVRNNDENKIGFLSIENRVCVALSRARNGLYIMGNITQLCHDNELWRQIKTTLEKQNAIGTELSLRCQIHTDTITHVACGDDFLGISEGGCTKKCESELMCGHKCASVCHILDRNHINYKCQVQCNKSLCNKDESHVCKKMCFENCGPCTYLVEQSLPCGHEVNIKCHIDVKSYNCEVLVTTTLPCGHIVDKPCSCDPETFRCPKICDIQVERCGHACELLCHIRRDPDHLEYKCYKRCAKFMKNCTVEEDTHRCKKLCHEECDECTINVLKPRTVCTHFYEVPCNSDVDTIICEKPCTKVLTCGHTCKGLCKDPCPKCQIRVSKIVPECGHHVKVKCCEFPSRKYCNKKCPLKLPCGHDCTNKCNEPCTTLCRVIVDCSGVIADCGHLIARAECNMTKSGVDPKLLLKYCEAPCGVKLKCGHLCSGSCGECAQGRIHKRCTQKCGDLLVCNHQCDFPCRQACRPCKRRCSYRCEHSSCHKNCGEVCTPCKEICPRNCKHQRCTKFCGDICNVPPCSEPCAELLECGHPCIGFCGDPCPPKCLICHEDDVLEVFFGTETEDARYVLLKDCNHIVESDGMEMWLQQNKFQVSYKLCPKCKTPIKTTQRYSDYIKKAVQDVAKVKIRLSGTPKEIDENRRQLVIKLNRMFNISVTNNLTVSSYFYNFLNSLRTRLQVSKKGKRQPINIHEIHSIKVKFQITEDIIHICSAQNICIRQKDTKEIGQINFIFQALCRDVDYISGQEIDDIYCEIRRLSRMMEYHSIKKTSQFATYSINNDKAKNLISDIEKITFRYKRFTNEDDDTLKKLLKELNSVVSSGINISEKEKREILAAMGFKRGHWFKCPNGHIYAIGECGGAMEESKCNECGARIGGSHHRLLSDNAVASEMDGATRGAWSETVLYYNRHFNN